MLTFTREKLYNLLIYVNDTKVQNEFKSLF